MLQMNKIIAIVLMSLIAAMGIFNYFTSSKLRSVEKSLEKSLSEVSRLKVDNNTLLSQIEAFRVREDAIKKAVEGTREGLDRLEKDVEDAKSKIRKEHTENSSSDPPISDFTYGVLNDLCDRIRGEKCPTF